MIGKWSKRPTVFWSNVWLLCISCADVALIISGIAYPNALSPIGANWTCISV